MTNVPEGVLAASVSALAGVNAPGREVRLSVLVTDHLDRAARIVRALGAPAEELEDLVHQAFSITAARLVDIDAGKESAFLVETAVRLAANARRRRARGREVPTAELPDVADDRPSPEELSDQRRALRLLDRVLDQMDEELCTVLVLCEIEQMTMADVAAAIRVPTGTVASRLRRARADFHDRVHRLGLDGAATGGRR
jgi:RNA polymerase sigma-70 factor (ECF subfamily)